jgi:hypothetical protein
LKTTASALPVRSSSRRKTIGSPFFVVSCLTRDDPADGDDLAVAAALELGERASVLRRSSVADSRSGCSET